jgi:hypothetical protein
MKLITEVSIWDNGKIKKASILNAYAINLVLNESATFYYSLSTLNAAGSQGEILASGNLSMTGDDYLNWTSDNGVWHFVADSLNLVIVGDYAAPIVSQPIAESLIVDSTNDAIIETPIVTENISVEKIIESPIIETLVHSVLEQLIVEPVMEESVATEPIVEQPIVGEAPVTEETVTGEIIASEEPIVENDESI